MADRETPSGKSAEIPCRVLLAEDDHDLRQGLADYLHLRGLDVTEAASGIEFYRALSKSGFDVAVVDVNLPDVSGFSLVAEASATRKMGIILLTARSGRDDRVRGYDAGADLYLVKPVDGEELTLAIRNLARRTRLGSATENAADAAIASPAEWVLDRWAQSLRVPDQGAVKLSARETILLEYLAGRPGVTVARHEIAGLFDDTAEPESRRIDAALARLRAKLATTGSASPVQVVHGKGVRLVRSIRLA